MLVHKASKCILATFVMPDPCGDGLKEVRATFDNLEKAGIDIDPKEWWDVPNKGTLAEKLKRSAPDFEPVEDSETGALVDIIETQYRSLSEYRQNIRKEKAAERGRVKANAVARGYRRVYRNTPEQEMSLGFLHEALQARTQKAKKP